jgi:serine/threonine protein kinase
MRLSSGVRLGPYEIVAPLGAGGMGEVYKAKDTRLDRSVAIKVLHAHLVDNTELRQRLEREGKTVSSLSHPHICILHDIGHQDGIDYLVMEYLEGETLASRMAKGPLSLEQAIPIAIQIADGLEAAHRKNVIHRDLKPANIMLTRSGAKLLDFGLARIDKCISAEDNTITAGLTSPGAILGTFHYMAPEQLEGKNADARSDVFAFGAVRMKW